jgi:hypothetical protein
MNYHFRAVDLKILMLIFILFAITINSYPLIFANRGDEAFATPPYIDGNSSTIQSCIIDGAGYYLKGYSDILLFLQAIEWSDPEKVNDEDLKMLVNRAIDTMKSADSVYARLKVLADATPYNMVFIEKLMAFDYIGFQRSRSAYGSAFNATWKYLSTGDVRGLFAHIKAGTDYILTMLLDIKASLDAGKFPSLSSLWRLNQKSWEIMLTGQYAAEIFYETGSK